MATGVTSVDELLERIQRHPEFERLKRELNSIPTVVQRIEYIDRKVYEEFRNSPPVLGDPRTNLLFRQQLSTLGMPILCPYLQVEGANTATGQDCLVPGAQREQCCHGRADACAIYARQDRAPWPASSDRCLVDLGDLDDWWRGNGRYG